MIARHPASTRWLTLLWALVVTLGLSVLVAILQVTGVLAGWWSLAASLVYLPVIAYALLVSNPSCFR